MGITTYLNPDVIKDRDISASKIGAMSKSITWSELKTLRDGGQLIPGMQYRITDYICTTTQQYTKSAGHAFDIIVTADSESVLNEEARAIQHEGDTYFSGCDLNAWKIWYCLDNDTTRFDWADGTNGKGVIYRMIDEWNNDVPYDFKNIQYNPYTTRYKYYYYTFASDNVEDNTDCSLDIANRCYSNTIKEYITSNVRKLNCITFVGSKCYSNSFGASCYKNSFGKLCYRNTFGNDCDSNSFGDNCNSNSFGNDCDSNFFGNSCEYNSFGNQCSSSSLRNGCQGNSFGNYCYGILFGNYCSFNYVGNNCDGIRSGDWLQCNSFGDSCEGIYFALDSYSTSTKYNYYLNNHFGDGCKAIIFTGAETASKENQIQNYNFAQGLKSITVDGVRNRNFETKVENDSNGNLKEFCLADFIYDENADSYYYSASFIGEI